MQLVDNPVELVTALTDLVMAGVGGVSCFLIFRLKTAAYWQQQLWLITFGMFTLACVLGAIHHGIALSSSLYDLSWSAILLLLGTMVGLFVVACCHDLWGREIATKVLPAMIVIALGFFATSWWLGQDFRLFILYEALALVFAQVGYLYLAAKGVPGSVALSGGIALTILAAIVQATRWVTLVPDYPFDHNAAYHMIQIPAVILLTIGIRRSLKASSMEVPSVLQP